MATASDQALQPFDQQLRGLLARQTTLLQRHSTGLSLLRALLADEGQLSAWPRSVLEAYVWEDEQLHSEMGALVAEGAGVRARLQDEVQAEKEGLGREREQLRGERGRMYGWVKMEKEQMREWLEPQIRKQVKEEEETRLREMEEERERDGGDAESSVARD